MTPRSLRCTRRRWSRATDVDKGQERERERVGERERERETGRETERETEKERDREGQRETERDRETEKDRESNAHQQHPTWRDSSAQGSAQIGMDGFDHYKLAQAAESATPWSHWAQDC